MAGGVTFDPAEFQAFKAQASGAAGRFDPAEFASYKAEQARPAPEPGSAQQLAAARAATASPYVEGGLPDMPSSEDLHRQGAGVPTGLYAGTSSAMDSMPRLIVQGLGSSVNALRPSHCLRCPQRGRRPPLPHRRRS